MPKPDINADLFSAHTTVLIVAVNAYESADFKSLTGPLKNAECLKSALTDINGCAIPGSQVNVLPEELSAAEILAAIAHAAQHVGSGDLFILYFCGHGAIADDQFYLCLQSSSLSNLSKTGISSADLEIALQESKARGILLIVDCCHAGSLGRYAPALFQDARQGDFRILMSSSGADEASWDLGERGTLFSRYLIDAVDGTKPIAVSNPGFIYLSDLLKFIQSSVQEYEDQVHLDFAEQMPRLVGFHALDPLLFVHRRLTFAQISLKSLRYSREYIRNRTKRLVLSLAVLSTFLLGTFYTWLDHHNFVVNENSVLVVKDGDPRIAFLDLPRTVRVLELPPAALPDASPLHHAGGAVTGKLGGDVVPSVYSQVRPEILWLGIGSQGDLRAAFVSLQQSLLHGVEPPYFAFPTAELIVKDQASVSDVSDLRKIASSGNARISYLGWLGLLNSDIFPGPTDMAIFGFGSFFYLDRLALSLRGTCTQAKKDFLSTIVGGTSTAVVGRSYSQGILAMLTLQCKFTAKELASLRLRTAFSPYARKYRDDDLSVLAFLSDGASFRQELKTFLDQQDTVPPSESAQRDVRTVLSTLQVDPEHPCSAGLEKFLSSAPAIHVSTAFLLFRTCGRYDDLFRQPESSTGPNVLDVVRLGAMTEDELLSLLSSPRDQFTYQFALLSISHLKRILKREQFVAAVLPLLGVDNPSVQSGAIGALTLLRYDGKEILQLPRLNSSVVSATEWWMKEVHPESLRRFVFQNLGSMDAVTTAEIMADEAPLTGEERIQLIKLSLRGDDDEQQVAGCLLSVYGTVDDQLQVLHAPQLAARSGAKACAIYGPKFDDVISRVDKGDRSDALLSASLRRRRSCVVIFASTLRTLPPWAKNWALGLFFTETPMLPPAPNLLFHTPRVGPLEWWTDAPTTATGGGTSRPAT